MACPSEARTAPRETAQVPRDFSYRPLQRPKTALWHYCREFGTFIQSISLVVHLCSIQILHLAYIYLFVYSLIYLFIDVLLFVAFFARGAGVGQPGPFRPERPGPELPGPALRQRLRKPKHRTRENRLKMVWCSYGKRNARNWINCSNQIYDIPLVFPYAQPYPQKDARQCSSAWVPLDPALKQAPCTVQLASCS